MANLHANRPLSTAALVAALLGVSACQTSQPTSAGSGGGGIGGMSRQETLGTGAGAIAGGLAGYALTKGAGGALIGAAAGALIGNRIGNHLEGTDQEAAAQAAAKAATLKAGETVEWEKSGATFQVSAHGSATALGEPFSDARGNQCRRVYQTATKDGVTEEDVITLCDGSSGWVRIRDSTGAASPKMRSSRSNRDSTLR